MCWCPDGQASLLTYDGEPLELHDDPDLLFELRRHGFPPRAVPTEAHQTAMLQRLDSASRGDAERWRCFAQCAESVNAMEQRIHAAMAQPGGDVVLLAGGTGGLGASHDRPGMSAFRLRCVLSRNWCILCYAAP